MTVFRVHNADFHGEEGFAKVVASTAQQAAITWLEGHIDMAACESLKDPDSDESLEVTITPDDKDAASSEVFIVYAEYVLTCYARPKP